MDKFTLNPAILFSRIITGTTTEADGYSFLLWLTALLVVAIVAIII